MARERPAVLLVDDEPGILFSVSRLLERAGFLVITAASAPTAIEQVRARRFEAVVCDLCMPGMSGADLCAWLRLEAPELGDRIIIATGDPTLTDRAGVAIAGLPVLLKPYSFGDLLALLASLSPVQDALRAAS